MIRRGKYKDRTAVIVESDRLRATLLPDDGAKMASLIDLATGKEFLATKESEAYGVLAYDGSYIHSECSAFDDMFPTIDPYTPTHGVYKGVTYPDHGESCRLPFEVRVEKDKAILSTHSRLFPLRMTKTVSPAADGGISLRYDITNEGNTPFDFIWAGHIILKGEDGSRLLTPFDEDTPTEMIFATEGYAHDTLPKDRLTGYRQGEGAAYKFYYTEPLREGYFALSYTDGRILSFRFDREKLPYLGVWLNNGEFQDLYSIAPEPCTAPFDAPDKASAKGYVSKISANTSFSFEIHIQIGENI